MSHKQYQYGMTTSCVSTPTDTLVSTGSTNDVTSHFQRIQNYAAQVILHLPRSSIITTHLKSLHWLPVEERSIYKKACLCYHFQSIGITANHYYKPQHYCTMSLTWSRKTHHTLAPAHTPCLFSIDLQTVRKNSVIAHFLLLLHMSGTLFQMMPGVPHHCHHLSLV